MDNEMQQDTQPNSRFRPRLVLDHGYVAYVEHWGSDQSIIEAARMSIDGAFKGWGREPRLDDCKHCGVIRKNAYDYEGNLLLKGNAKFEACAGIHEWNTRPGDERLLRYLWEHKHATPFEMAGMIIEVKAPIFIYRQWHRHRTQSYNEMSARYTPLPNENYTPTVERLTMRSGKNKQAKGKKELLERDAIIFQKELQRVYTMQEGFYQRALSDGVPKELARIHLPVGRYSRMRAGAVLRNWLAFLTLRMDSHAQWEIQEYARAVGSIISDLFPRTWALFLEGHEQRAAEA